MAKLIGVVFSIAAGIIAGKEGPFVHGGGIVGGGIGAMGSQCGSLRSGRGFYRYSDYSLAACHLYAPGPIASSGQGRR